jgi:hypothetical protein
MKLITTIKYNEVDFKFISSHYDLHLDGTCLYNKKLCQFKTILGDWNKEKDEWEYDFCQIYELNLKEKIKWKLRQKKFEWMVGYHWTYPKKKDTHFHYRKPKWLYVFLFNLFYKR